MLARHVVACPAVVLLTPPRPRCLQRGRQMALKVARHEAGQVQKTITLLRRECRCCHSGATSA